MRDLRAFSSDGQSYRLITGWSQVRVLQGAPTLLAFVTSRSEAKRMGVCSGSTMYELGAPTLLAFVTSRSEAKRMGVCSASTMYELGTPIKKPLFASGFLLETEMFTIYLI